MSLLTSLLAPAGASYGVRAKRTTAQAIPTASFTPVALTSEDYDDGGFHDNATNNSRCTIPAGQGGRRFRIVGSITYTTTAATGRRLLELRKNGTAIQRAETPPASGGATTITISRTDTPADGDYYELYAYHTFGSDVNLDAATYNNSYLELERL